MSALCRKFAKVISARTAEREETGKTIILSVMEDPMRRVGILGGTFDPVHNGHLLLGEQAHREYGLDEIWFMPSHVPPAQKRSSYHRRSGSASGCWSLPRESVPYFQVSDFEMGREGNTYTAQTLALLKEAYPDIEVYFIIGADSLYQLESWYHPEQVMAQAVLLVSGRTYEDGGVSLEDEVSYLNKKYGVMIRILHNPKIEEAVRGLRKRRRWGRTSRRHARSRCKLHQGNRIVQEIEAGKLQGDSPAPDCNKTGENEGTVREISRRGRFRKKIHYG